MQGEPPASSPSALALALALSSFAAAQLRTLAAAAAASGGGDDGDDDTVLLLGFAPPRAPSARGRAAPWLVLSLRRVRVPRGGEPSESRAYVDPCNGDRVRTPAGLAAVGLLLLAPLSGVDSGAGASAGDDSSAQAHLLLGAGLPVVRARFLHAAAVLALDTPAAGFLCGTLPRGGGARDTAVVFRAVAESPAVDPPRALLLSPPVPADCPPAAAFERALASRALLCVATGAFPAAADEAALRARLCASPCFLVDGVPGLLLPSSAEPLAAVLAARCRRLSAPAGRRVSAARALPAPPPLCTFARICTPSTPPALSPVLHVRDGGGVAPCDASPCPVVVVSTACFLPADATAGAAAGVLADALLESASRRRGPRGLRVRYFAPMGCPHTIAVERAVAARGGGRIAGRGLDADDDEEEVVAAEDADDEEEDEDTEAERQLRARIHREFSLPLNRPLFRRSCALLRISPLPARAPVASAAALPPALSSPTAEPLLDVHEFIRGAGGARSSGAVVSAVVEGRYEYHHYDTGGHRVGWRASDVGWGCAYRSLQTLASWFRLQGYSSLPVPTHLEVQRTLVTLGDKPASFLRSAQWIGAVEVGMVLERRYGVSYRILDFRSGADIPAKARELVAHFEEQGTPVMVGGGVLAYTLLGVEFDPASGDVRFLILDPHYVGEDRAQVVCDKGWCAWKPSSIFRADAFYNLCLPQRPHFY